MSDSLVLGVVAGLIVLAIVAIIVGLLAFFGRRREPDDATVVSIVQRVALLVALQGGVSRSDVDVLLDMIDQTNQRVTDAESGLANLRGDLTTAQSGLAAAQSGVAGLRGDLTTAQAGLATAQSNIAILRRDLNTVRRNCDDRYRQVMARLDGLGRRISAIRLWDYVLQFGFDWAVVVGLGSYLLIAIFAGLGFGWFASLSATAPTNALFCAFIAGSIAAVVRGRRNRA